jgi:hypothetical protein
MTTLKPTIAIKIELVGRYCRNDTKHGLKGHTNCPYRADSRCTLFRQELNLGTTGEWLRLKECKESEKPQ